ncbi:hypothetical protein MTO96_031641 [Rhipicephalus appendiculatus]
MRCKRRTLPGRAPRLQNVKVKGMSARGWEASYINGSRSTPKNSETPLQAAHQETSAIHKHDCREQQVLPPHYFGVGCSLQHGQPPSSASDVEDSEGASAATVAFGRGYGGGFGRGIGGYGPGLGGYGRGFNG